MGFSSPLALRSPSATRRRALAALGVAGVSALLGSGLVGCSPPVPFAGIDITGADYATAFALTDHTGRQRTLQDFQGQVVVLFFGFTQCPDVCPTTLTELAQAKALLGEQGARVQGLFISIDPERDTPQVMQEYLASFDPGFLALYAAPDALPALAQSFKIYYKKVPGPTPTSYTMDHSALSYVYDPQGRIRLAHRYGSGAEALAGDIRRLLAE